MSSEQPTKRPRLDSVALAQTHSSDTDGHNEFNKDEVELGIIGLGDMGRVYAHAFLRAGWRRVNVCDLPSRYEELKKAHAGSGFNIFPDGFAVSRRSDFIIYCVEAANIEAVVAKYGPATKVGAIVSGQTSVKEPEIKAFEKYLPPDVHIVSCHSLHGPNVDPRGQPLVMIRHRADDRSFNLAVSVLNSLHSNMVHLSYLQHDKITADTQAVTHVAFLRYGFVVEQDASILYGDGMEVRFEFPGNWENPSYVGGIENVKVLMTLRIYGAKWHVYGGLAIMNPSAKPQIRQYAQSVSDLFKLMIQEKEQEFRERLEKAAKFVFHDGNDPILLSDDLLDKFSLSAIPKEKRKPNSHLSLLAMVDCWHKMGINPYDHLICQTPPFRLLLGITEYCFRNKEFLTEAIQAALYDKDIRGDDMEFCNAVRGWAEIIELGSMPGYEKRFSSTAKFFKDRLSQASKASSSLIAMIAQKTQQDLE
ncbi:prephenate dehydrogenase (NADP(+)) [Quaeritorhiza haematococci]|nr:prephenate dehydrogenase (NADP(+)) [Quaeritorhiza haematococci]